MSEDRPSPLASENEERAAQQRAAEMRIERRARELARGRVSSALFYAVGAVGALLVVVVTAAVAVVVISLAAVAVKWAAGLL